VRARAPWNGGTVDVEDEVSQAAYQCAKTATCALPFCVSAIDTSTCEVGAGASVQGVRVFMAVMPMLMLLLFYGLHTRGTRPWYQRKQVVDSGRGRLTMER
jgi:hypothetical protein